jgi:hypothetical protein
MLMASAGLVTLWIRNFWRADVAWLPLPSGGNVMIVSQKGQMEFVISTPAAALRQAMPPRHDVALCGVDSYSIIREGASDVPVSIVEAVALPAAVGRRQAEHHDAVLVPNPDYNAAHFRAVDHVVHSIQLTRTAYWDHHNRHCPWDLRKKPMVMCSRRITYRKSLSFKPAWPLLRRLRQRTWHAC